MAKKEYIEREKVLALQTDLHFDNIEQLKYWKCRHIDPIEVQLLPAADVRPVVHGEWIWEEPNSANRFRGCFLCNKCFESMYTKKNFCPNCGADMRKELENG